MAMRRRELIGGVVTAGVLAVGAAVAGYVFSSGGETVAIEAPAAQTPAPPEARAAQPPAQPAVPLARATTGPATPKAAIEAFQEAMQKGDPEAYNRFMHFTSPDQRDYGEAQAEKVASGNRFRNAVVQRFGQIPQEHEQWFSKTLYGRPLDLELFTESGSGERATLTPPPDAPPMAFQLALVEGQWKILFEETFAKSNARQGGSSIQRPILQARAKANAYAQTADEVAVGRYGSASQAMDTLLGRLMEADRQVDQTLAAAAAGRR